MEFIKEPKKALFYLLLFIALLWFGDWMGWDLSLVEKDEICFGY